MGTANYRSQASHELTPPWFCCKKKFQVTPIGTNRGLPCQEGKSNLLSSRKVSAEVLCPAWDALLQEKDALVRKTPDKMQI